MIASLDLSAEMSTIFIEVAILIVGIGKPLSTKILYTDPFYRPTNKHSFLGGPLTTLTNLILESMIHSLSNMPVNANN
jgi:hypothetical protein